MVPDPTLRQVDINYQDGLWFFRFTDRAATQAITVTISDPLEPADEWEVHTGLSPLVGHQQPSIDLGSLRVGPARVVKAAAEHWTECDVRGLGLIGMRDQLTWNIFCNLPDGVVSAVVDGITGEFTPSSAPPARVPSTATPGK
jgi:hypothetical protein